jgi:hypothetical protein
VTQTHEDAVKRKHQERKEEGAHFTLFHKTSKTDITRKESYVPMSLIYIM